MAAIEPDDNGINPYAPPLAADALGSGTIGEDSPYVTLRKAHLHREAAVRTIGGWFYLFALWILATTIYETADLINAVRSRVDPPELLYVLHAHPVTIVWGFVLTCICAAFGNGVRHLRDAARWGCVVVLTMYFLGFCLATVGILGQHQLLGAFGAALLSVSTASLLGVLLSPSTGAVFTRRYREAVSKTPGLKPRLEFGGAVTCGLATALFILGIAIMEIVKMR